MKLITTGALLILMITGFGCSATSVSQEEPSDQPLVLLLHGLARSASSMHDMELALEEAGYHVCNIDLN